MKYLRVAKTLAYMAGVALSVLGLVALQTRPGAALSEPPMAAVQRVWQNAEALGAYHYNTSIIQTTWPVARLENAGLSSRQERVYIEGETDLPTKSMQMALWSEDGSVGTRQSALAVRVEGGQAFGRVGEQEWQEIDDFTGLFAPDGDALSYLAGAVNIRRAGSETRGLPPSSEIRFTRYSFDMDGRTFAVHMRGLLEAELRRKGKLPAGLSLDLLPHYVEMTGDGELWVDTDDLPLRQILRLRFPPDATNLEWMEAEITTDFSHWERQQLAAASSGGMGERTLSALSSVRLRLPDPQFFTSLGMGVGLLALLALALRKRRSRYVYNAVVLCTTFSMLIAPPAPGPTGGCIL